MNFSHVEEAVGVQHPVSWKLRKSIKNAVFFFFNSFQLTRDFLSGKTRNSLNLRSRYERRRIINQILSIKVSEMIFFFFLDYYCLDDSKRC